MVTLQYRGRTPDSDAAAVPKSYADAQYQAQAVTTTIVNAKIATAADTLTTQTYVDQQDALRAHKTDVTTADTNYVASTELGQPNGVASLDASGFVPATQLPAGIVTDKVARCYSIASPAGALGGTPSGTGVVGAVQLTGSHTVTTTTPREYQIASIPVPDPGYPWRALPFAWVQGKSGGVDPGDRHVGNSNYGLLAVMPPPGDNTVYGAGVCTASPYFDIYGVVPYAKLGQTPTSVPAINGALELRLYGSCWSGTSYIFTATNIVYFVLVFPAL